MVYVGVCPYMVVPWWVLSERTMHTTTTTTTTDEKHYRHELLRQTDRQTDPLMPRPSIKREI